MSRTVYENPEEWEQKREETEKQWPEYRHSTLALSRPTYQSANDSVDEQTWRRLYLREDVEVLQQLKQHHVHNPPTEPGGPRTPLDHCRSKEDPTKCKAGFPRNQQLIDNTALLCKGLAEEMKMPVKGKRSALGRLWGPCNDPNLNGNHPALLAALHCNGDVQVPYRFPITEDLHDACGRCDKSCHAEQNLQEMTQQEQVNQAAQAGYACDYSNKRNPIAVHEVKEWQRSQAELATELENNPSSGYVGARASKRLMTQCFARGVVRGSVECANLIDNAGHSDPTAAETVKTAQTTDMSFNFGVQLLQAATEGIPLPVEREKLRSDLTKSTTVIAKKAVAQPQIWTLYGNRGKDPRLEPLSEAAAAARNGHSAGFHALLTEQGKEKFARKKTKKRLAGRRRLPHPGRRWTGLDAAGPRQPASSPATSRARGLRSAGQPQRAGAHHQDPRTLLPVDQQPEGRH